MDIMTSYIARKGEKYSQQENKEKDDAKLYTYIIKKRKQIAGIIYRPQNRHLRPFYHAGTIKLGLKDELNVLKKIFEMFGEGEYIILHFPPRRKKNGFRTFWTGKLPTGKLLKLLVKKDDE